jgi:DNA-directed RNA polymerase subunit M/transcription elongation factor TFIIS
MDNTKQQKTEKKNEEEESDEDSEVVSSESEEESELFTSDSDVPSDLDSSNSEDVSEGEEEIEEAVEPEPDEEIEEEEPEEIEEEEEEEFPESEEEEIEDEPDVETTNEAEEGNNEDYIQEKAEKTVNLDRVISRKYRFTIYMNRLSVDYYETNKTNSKDIDFGKIRTIFDTLNVPNSNRTVREVFLEKCRKLYPEEKYEKIPKMPKSEAVKMYLDSYYDTPSQTIVDSFKNVLSEYNPERKVEESINLCRKCGQNRTISRFVQLRRCDEPESEFVTCVNCEFCWRRD